MKTMVITPETGYEIQSIIMNVTVRDETKRCNLYMRYLEKIDKWVCSLSNIQTGEVYFENVPVICSYGETANDIWEPYFYKGIGMLFCFPKVSDPSTVDPSKDNFNEFFLVWSDGIE